MPEHYTKATTQATVWCKRCGKPAPHRIDNGRRGPCLVCLSRLEAGAAKHADNPKPPPTQISLFK